MEYKKIGGLWNPENSPEIKGKLLRIEENIKVNGYDYEKAYTIETDDLVVKICGAAVLDSLMELFKVGDFLKIVYKGKKQGESKEYKDYEVYLGVESISN